MQVKSLARLSLRDPEYISVHADAEASTPLKLQQVHPTLAILVLPGVCQDEHASHVKAYSVV